MVSQTVEIKRTRELSNSGIFVQNAGRNKEKHLQKGKENLSLELGDVKKKEETVAS